MSESKFPLVEALGLKMLTIDFGQTAVVVAAHLERRLAQAPVIRGFVDDDYGWRYRSPDTGEKTHSARLIMIEPLKKPKVSRRELQEMIDGFSEKTGMIPALLKRILEDGLE